MNCFICEKPPKEGFITTFERAIVCRNCLELVMKKNKINIDMALQHVDKAWGIIKLRNKIRNK